MFGHRLLSNAGGRRRDGRPPAGKVIKRPLSEGTARAGGGGGAGPGERNRWAERCSLSALTDKQAADLRRRVFEDCIAEAEEDVMAAGAAAELPPPWRPRREEEVAVAVLGEKMVQVEETLAVAAAGKHDDGGDNDDDDDDASIAVNYHLEHYDRGGSRHRWTAPPPPRPATVTLGRSVTHGRSQSACLAPTRLRVPPQLKPVTTAPMAAPTVAISRVAPPGGPLHHHPPPPPSQPKQPQVWELPGADPVPPVVVALSRPHKMSAVVGPPARPAHPQQQHQYQQQQQQHQHQHQHPQHQHQQHQQQGFAPPSIRQRTSSWSGGPPPPPSSPRARADGQGPPQYRHHRPHHPHHPHQQHQQPAPPSPSQLIALSRELYSQYQTPQPIKRLPVKAQPGELFAALPGEVLELILDGVKELHMAAGSDSCATCWMRDLCSLAVASRKWYKFARTALYEDIHLVGADSLTHRKRFKLGQGARVLLLRRTVRSSPQVAAIVRSVRVPPPQLGTAPQAQEAYRDLVATLVMACPNLERLTGLAARYSHGFSRLFYALASRPKLKQAEWFLGPAVGAGGGVGGPRHGQAEDPRPLLPAEATTFRDLHARWSQLSTITIHSEPGAAILPAGLVDQTLARLPSLRHLHLSHVPAASFGDNSLLSLPASLRTLSLSHVAGVTPVGLSAFATRSASRHSLTSLTLRHVRLDSLAGLARILSNLSRLESLAVVQPNGPVPDEDTCIWLMPYLASPSLRRLHWDMTSSWSSPPGGAVVSAADSILARSIAAGGFPRLRSLRVLSDPDGAFQSLCRPTERIDLVADRFGVGQQHQFSGPAPPSSPADVASRPTTPSNAARSGGGGGWSVRSPSRGRQHASLDLSLSTGMPASESPPEATNLGRARVAAQGRLEAARHQPRFLVSVVDHGGGEDAPMQRPSPSPPQPLPLPPQSQSQSAAGGVLVEEFGLAGFLGTIGSPIAYHLLPDPNGGSDARGGLADAEDLLLPAPGPGAEDGSGSIVVGCCGRWNSGLSGGSAAAAGGAGAHYESKGGREAPWWHTERGRGASVA